MNRMDRMDPMDPMDAGQPGPEISRNPVAPQPRNPVTP